MLRLGWPAEVLRGLLPKPLKTLGGGSSAEMRKSLPLSLISLTFFAAAEVPPNTPLRAFARVRAARMRVKAFAR